MSKDSVGEDAVDEKLKERARQYLIQFIDIRYSNPHWKAADVGALATFLQTTQIQRDREWLEACYEFPDYSRLLKLVDATYHTFQFKEFEEWNKRKKRIRTLAAGKASVK